MTDKPANPAFHWACIEGAVLGYLVGCEGASADQIAFYFDMSSRAVTAALRDLNFSGLVEVDPEYDKKYDVLIWRATHKGRAQWNIAQAGAEA